MSTPAAWFEYGLDEGVAGVAFASADERRARAALTASSPFDVESDVGVRADVERARDVAFLSLLDALAHDKGAVPQAADGYFRLARESLFDRGSSNVSRDLLRCALAGVLADRSADVRRLLGHFELTSDVLVEGVADDWASSVAEAVESSWLLLLRRRDWADIDAAQHLVIRLRELQADFEPTYLQTLDSGAATTAWELVAWYHLAKTSEILVEYLTQGTVDGRFDVSPRVDQQLSLSSRAADRAGHLYLSVTTLIARHASQAMISSSLWTVVRAKGQRATSFVRAMVSRDQVTPILELLPPQRRALADNGLMGSSHRSIVVSLPTSSGKTLISEFRILQALSQFEDLGGWVAYLAPTRALVNQVARKLRRDFLPLGIAVEKVSPALEVDSVEAAMLADPDPEKRFRILVTTPEKLNLMLRNGWEQTVGRPLSLVVVDEAHALAQGSRGVTLDLLLATANRECENANFLLMTPFIDDPEEVANWLAPQDHLAASLSVDWSPNDRVVAFATLGQAGAAGHSEITYALQDTALNTVGAGLEFSTAPARVLGKPASQLKSRRAVAAAVAQDLSNRGTSILLVDSPAAAWDAAHDLASAPTSFVPSTRCAEVAAFLSDEMGNDFPLASLLKAGVGVHHGGLSEDARALVEYLTEHGDLRVLVATTTVAQGVNFPVSSVVFASTDYRARSHPFRVKMPAADFWNIAGRAGRIGQEDVGIVAIAVRDDSDREVAREYLESASHSLVSAIVQMVRDAKAAGKLANLESLSHGKDWSSFVQFLAHAIRSGGFGERRADDVEQLLRGTLGYLQLREEDPSTADLLVASVQRYVERVAHGPLGLVDATGFSPESVVAAIARSKEAGIGPEILAPERVFGEGDVLATAMGVLLQVPELREELKDVTGGSDRNGDTLARIVTDWVSGASLDALASTYFSVKQNADGTESEVDPTAAMTACCRSIFGRLTNASAWGLAALQSIVMAGDKQQLSEESAARARLIPAMVFYGVSSEAAVILRNCGVPRSVAQDLANAGFAHHGEPLHRVRDLLRSSGVQPWMQAAGDRGTRAYRAWAMLDGGDVP